MNFLEKLLNFFRRDAGVSPWVRTMINGLQEQPDMFQFAPRFVPALPIHPGLEVDAVILSFKSSSLEWHANLDLVDMAARHMEIVMTKDEVYFRDIYNSRYGLYPQESAQVTSACMNWLRNQGE